MTEPRTAETRYGYQLYPWFNNLNDKVAYERMFAEGHPQKMRVAQAMISQDPTTSNAEIRRNMTTRGTPPRFGYNTDELTISGVLNNQFQSADHVNDTAWNEFSGTNSEIDATERPSGSIW